MFFDCKVFDKNGNLTRVHPAAEFEEKSRLEYASILDEENRKSIKNFDFTPLDEYEVSIGYSL